MRARLDELVREVEVVLEVVLGLGGVSHVARVGNGRLDDAAGLAHGIHAQHQVRHVVEAVKHTEHVHAVRLGELAEPGEKEKGRILLPKSSVILLNLGKIKAQHNLQTPDTVISYL